MHYARVCQLRRLHRHLNKKKLGAQERTRTFTPLRELVPETSASTNSATWAGADIEYSMAALCLPARCLED